MVWLIDVREVEGVECVERDGGSGVDAIKGDGCTLKWSNPGRVAGRCGGRIDRGVGCSCGIGSKPVVSCSLNFFSGGFVSFVCLSFNFSFSLSLSLALSLSLSLVFSFPGSLSLVLSFCLSVSLSLVRSRFFSFVSLYLVSLSLFSFAFVSCGSSVAASFFSSSSFATAASTRLVR